MLVGLLLAFGAALTTGVASVLQAVAARRGKNVARLVVSPLYLGGTGLDAVGFGCTVGALHWLPLFLVNCAAASSVGVTALVGRRVLGTVLHRRDLWALLGLGGGLVLLASGAKPEAATALDQWGQWMLVFSAAPIVAGGLLLMRARGRAGGVLAAVSGLAFAGTSVGSRVLSNAHSLRSVITAPVSYALIAFGIGGMMFFAAALQRTAVTIATAALFGVQTVAASAVGLTVLGDSTRADFEAPTAIGFVLALGGALALALSESEPERAPAARGTVGAAMPADRHG